MNYKLRIIKNLFIIILLAVIIFAPVISFAQPSNTTSGNFTDNPSTPTSGDFSPSAKIDNPIVADSIQGFIKQVLEGVVKIGIPIVALAIIYCGFLFVMARGKPEEIKKAKSALIYTLIGAAILLGAWAIAQLISDTVLSIKT